MYDGYKRVSLTTGEWVVLPAGPPVDRERIVRERLEAERDLRQGRLFGVWFLEVVSVQDAHEAQWWPAGL